MTDDQPVLETPAVRATRTVLVVDLVESVRLIEEDEDGTIARWRRLVDQVEQRVLPSCEGRLVKSLGDGMLLEFPRVQPALSAAFAINHASNRANVDVDERRQLLLRMGMEVSEVTADHHDVYGRGVNLAARLTTLAGPGEIVVSSRVRDQLAPVLDADVEDLGDTYLKHVQEPVRAYRVGPPGPRPVIEPSIAVGELQPTIAVIPFAVAGSETDERVLGEVLAEQVIEALSRSSELNVISRLSTSAFSGRGASLDEIAAHLNANYVLSGVCHVRGEKIALHAELAEAKSGRIVWSDRVNGRVAGLLRPDSEVIAAVVQQIAAAVTAREVQRASAQPLPTLKSYTLLLSAISLMHRLSARDFEQAHRLLQALTERAPRLAVPQAWLAKWHVLRVWQGWSPDPARDASLGLDCTRRALDADPQCSLALAVDALVHMNLLKDLDTANDRLELALQVNPNDSLAWLLNGLMHAFKGEGKPAVRATRRARRLSPLDPMRYYYDSLSATAALSAKKYERAIELARRSLRANRTHASTWRAMAIAQWESGQTEAAHKTVAELMRLEPTLTVSGYLERMPGGDRGVGRPWAEALRQAGVPER